MPDARPMLGVMSINLQLNDREFERLKQLVRETTAIELNESKRQLAHSRFSRRIRALGLNSFSQYIELIDEGDAAELEQFTSAITTNFSSFFREFHHFEFLREFLGRIAGPKRLRIWSAGCSTGEEPYSIAMTLLDTLPDVEQWDVRILATDIDVNALAEARAGIYSSQRIDNVSDAVRQRWFRRGTGQYEHFARVSPKVQSLVHFKQLNLIGQWPMRGPFDLIFCRNVVIYFGQEVKQRIFSRFARLQVPGAPLIIGHSENLANLCTSYRPIGNTIYEHL